MKKSSSGQSLSVFVLATAIFFTGLFLQMIVLPGISRYTISLKNAKLLLIKCRAEN